ncbi:DNA-directed RNA polymerase subunit beta' [Deferribacterales bacterium RsTz2092]|nr:DNA-directed RNA polymerase subunit beta' [Deferribacterales bacterium]
MAVATRGQGQLLKKGRTNQADAFKAMRIRIASPDKIRKWSHGEITKPETINYRTFKPERDGLFCAKIFGPVKDWECLCGKYKRMKHRGVVCEKCGVEVIESSVRRERMGHIELASPVAHIWFFKNTPSPMGYLLDMSVKDLERVIYFESWVVIDPKETDLKKHQILTDDNYRKAQEDFGLTGFVAGMGAEAIKELLKNLDINMLEVELREEIKSTTSVQKKLKLSKRLRVVNALANDRLHDAENGNKPDWMILDVLPVIPPELRPLVQLDGGSFAKSDLNDLYRNVINCNNRLRKWLDRSTPDIILRNEKRILQRAVDSLFDNTKRGMGKTARANDRHTLKSLSEIIKGKQGRFRQNLLGKRVDYSGRSVIVAGPHLKMHQCGIPKTMALELFKPFVYYKLEKELGLVQTIKQAKRMVDERAPEVWGVLEEVIKEHPVMLNRAPTLHRLGIQAFEPQLVEGKAIQLHPLVCPAFNADFDGDQMAVHVPLSMEAQLEARTLMLSSYNILSPASGNALAVPTQDMVLGVYYLTREMRNANGSGKSYSSPEEVVIAHDHGKLSLQAVIKVRMEIDGVHQLIETTPGRIIIGKILPDGISFHEVNKVLGKKDIGKLVNTVSIKLGSYDCAQFLDDLKDLGFKYSTQAGYSICLDDVLVPVDKDKIVEDTYKDVHSIELSYREGALTAEEKHNQLVEKWNTANTKITTALMNTIKARGGDASKTSKRDKWYNPIYVFADSGARGSQSQISQLGGMRGLMSDPSGNIIEAPVTSNFREGLTVLEYFDSTHGARKGLIDTALKTANAGYLTRRLVDVAQDVIISEEDCGTIRGRDVTAQLKDGKVEVSLADGIRGRFTAGDVLHPETGAVVVADNVMLGDDEINAIEKAAVDKVCVRSVLTCDTEFGVCRHCYGMDLSTRRLIEVGVAVGTIAAQSIGEPGTQLTMRTFHQGGIASTSNAVSSLSAKLGGDVELANVRTAKRGDDFVVLNRNGNIRIKDASGKVVDEQSLKRGSKLLVADGTKVGVGVKLAEWDPYVDDMMSEVAGVVSYSDLVWGETFKEETDPTTHITQKIVTMPSAVNKERNRKGVEGGSSKKRNPRILVKDANGNELGSYPLPQGSILSVENGADVEAGDVLAKILRTQKNVDITTGLSRVIEIFEARRPKEPSMLAEISGAVHIENKQGYDELTIANEFGEKQEYKIAARRSKDRDKDEQKYKRIAAQRYLNVRDGDIIKAGEPLVDGQDDPVDILRIRGQQALWDYMLQEIQAVYRGQGVPINDKHIEVIVRQMLRKVRVDDEGESKEFLPQEEVYRRRFDEEVNKLGHDGKQAPRGKLIVQGITKAAVNTESFISAASFQETSKVLTSAACSGKVDYLRGLKENVIMGRLIPAGTGSKHLLAERFRFQDDRKRVYEDKPEDATAELAETN